VTVCSAGRNDPDDVTVRSVAMAHDKNSQGRAHAEQHESVLVVRMLEIVDQETTFV